MNTRLLDVSVVICAYTDERWHDLVAAVSSIHQQNTPPREIIVVIDHNPHLLEQVQMHLPGVIALENSGPQGLSGTRNSGIAKAQGALIAFLDDDALAEPDWLVQLSRHCEDSQVLGVGGVVEPVWLDKRPVWLPEEFYWVVGCTYRGLPETAQAVRNPIGANIAFRREVFETVGGFRSGIGRVGKYPVGCEETELCIRAHQQWPERIFLYQPRATVFHRVPGNRTSWRYFCERCYAEGLSKAVVTRYVGVKDSLASERTYTLRTLPNAIVRNLIDVLFRADLTGLLRAGAIVVGLAVTVIGYFMGSIFSEVARPRNILGREIKNGGP
jgi:GT2 family glycosyltransferase